MRVTDFRKQLKAGMAAEGLSPYAKLIWVYLFGANPTTNRLLSERLGIEEEFVEAAIADLRNAKMISRKNGVWRAVEFVFEQEVVYRGDQFVVDATNRVADIYNLRRAEAAMLKLMDSASNTKAFERTARFLNENGGDVSEYIDFCIDKLSFAVKQGKFNFISPQHLAGPFCQEAWMQKGLPDKVGIEAEPSKGHAGKFYSDPTLARNALEDAGFNTKKFSDADIRHILGYAKDLISLAGQITEFDVDEDRRKEVAWLRDHILKTGSFMPRRK